MSSIFWKNVLIIALIAALGLSLVGIGYVKGKDSCQIKEAVATSEGEKKYAKIESKVMSLPDADLNKQLCAHWVRNPCPKGGL